MDFTANSVDWNAVALVIIATAILSWVYFRTNWPKKRRQSIVLLGSAMVILALYSGLLCTACEVQPTGRWVTSVASGCSDCGTRTCLAYARSDGSACTCTGNALHCGVNQDCGCKTWATMPATCHFVEYTGSCQTSDHGIGAYEKYQSCETYWKQIKCVSNADYAAKLAELKNQSSSGSGSGSGSGDTTKTDYASDKVDAKAGHDAFVASQRSVCSANNNGLLFDPNSYYCDGFPNYARYTSPKQVNGNTFPEYSTYVGCCIGSLITKTDAAANSSFASGSDNNLTQLNGTTIDLTQRHVANNDGKSQVCISKDYLCVDAAISGSPLLSSISCSDTATVYCPNGCDFSTAKCTTAGTTGTQSFDLGSITIFLLLIGAIVIVVIIAVRKRWR